MPYSPYINANGFNSQGIVNTPIQMQNNNNFNQQSILINNDNSPFLRNKK
jgi:hypothetical protein